MSVQQSKAALALTLIQVQTDSNTTPSARDSSSGPVSQSAHLWYGLCLQASSILQYLPR